MFYMVKFAGRALKLEKLSFNPRPSLSSVATDDRKQFLRLNIALNNNSIQFNSINASTSFSFLKDSK